ncbi:MAG: DUF3087 family protein [Pontibacterium sp.]
MKLQEINKPVYRNKQRKLAIVFGSVFLVLGLSISAAFRAWSGNPEGENMSTNMAGVLLGMLITAGIFYLFKSRPYFDEIRYAWNLKRQVLKIQNKKHLWKDKVVAGDQTAATVMAFYYAGVIQLQHLENNEFGQKEMSDERAEFEARCVPHNLTHDANHFSIDMLLEVK